MEVSQRALGEFLPSIVTVFEIQDCDTPELLNPFWPTPKPKRGRPSEVDSDGFLGGSASRVAAHPGWKSAKASQTELQGASGKQGVDQQPDEGDQEQHELDADENGYIHECDDWLKELELEVELLAG